MGVIFDETETGVKFEKGDYVEVLVQDNNRSTLFGKYLRHTNIRGELI